jgi:hypothetical protein
LKKVLLSFAGHTFMAMLVSVGLVVVFDLAARVLLSTIGLGEILQWLNIEAWYGPFVWGPGLLLGFFLNRHFRHRAACFSFILGVAWIAFGVLKAGSWRHGWSSRMAEARIDLFPLKQAECGTTECLGVLICTWPFINSVAYSIGALLGLLSRVDKTEEGERGESLARPSTLRLK